MWAGKVERRVVHGERWIGSLGVAAGQVFLSFCILCLEPLRQHGVSADGAGTDLCQRLFCPKPSPQHGSTPVRVVRIKQKANSSLHSPPLRRRSRMWVVSAPILHVTSWGSTTESGVESTSGHWDWFLGQQCPRPTQSVDSSIHGSNLSGSQGFLLYYQAYAQAWGPLAI